MGRRGNQRLALVIGNSGYLKANPLPNAAQDAISVAAQASRLDFEVFNPGGERGKPILDLEQLQINPLFEAFFKHIVPGATILLFYAGHGMQAGDENYVVPIDADLGAENPLGELIPLRPLIQRIARLAGPNGRVITLLDACRENPFSEPEMRRLAEIALKERGGLAANTPGFGTMKLAGDPATAGVFIAYATAPGDYAYDGGKQEANSPFTTAVLKHVGIRGLNLDEFAKRVGLDVEGWATAHRLNQRPWHETDLKNELMINPQRAQPMLELMSLGFVAGLAISFGLFDGDRLRAPFSAGQMDPQGIWVMLLGSAFGAVVALGTMRWGSRNGVHAAMAFAGTTVSFALATIIISSPFARVPEGAGTLQRTYSKAFESSAFQTYFVLALVAAALCYIGANLMRARAFDPTGYGARVARFTEVGIALCVLVGLIVLDLVLSIENPRIVAATGIWLFAAIVAAGGTALSLKPQGSVFLGFGSATGAISTALLSVLLFALTLMVPGNGWENLVIRLALAAWFAALGWQLGYCFSFYVPDYIQRRVVPIAKAKQQAGG